MRTIACVTGRIRPGIAVLLLAGTGLAAVASPASAHRANAEGLRLYGEGKYGEAQTAFASGLEQASVPLGDAAVLAYNQGLAQLRQGNLEPAVSSFNQALGSPDPQLRARAALASGNASFRKGEAGGEDEEALKQAIASMEAAQTAYEKALEASPTLADASANHELAQAKAAEFRRKLEELEKQRQREEQKEEEQKKDEEKEKEPQEKKPGEGQGDSGQDKPDADPNSQQKPEKGEPKPGEKPNPESGAGNDPAPPPEAGQDGETPQGRSGQPGEKAEAMTPQEAQMLLNAMRGEEKQQRDAMRARLMRQAGPEIPVEKDY